MVMLLSCFHLSLPTPSHPSLATPFPPLPSILPLLPFPPLPSIPSTPPPIPTSPLHPFHSSSSHLSPPSLPILIPFPPLPSIPSTPPLPTSPLHPFHFSPPSLPLLPFPPLPSSPSHLSPPPLPLLPFPPFAPTAAVYRGKYKHNVVAIKKSLTPSQMENASALAEEDDDQFYPEEALLLFRDFRQEVTVLSQLYHPNIVALLGVSLHPMCIVLEFAPKGSLFGILDKRIEAVKASQADAASTVPRMPGGVLGHMMTLKVALQVRGRKVHWIT